MPYNPGVQPRMGELIAAGVSRGSDGLAYGVSGMIERKKRENDSAAVFDRLRSLNPDLMPMEEQEWRGLSAKQKVRQGAAAVAAFHQDMQVRESKKRMEMAQEQFLQMQRRGLLDEKFGEEERGVALGNERERGRGLTFDNQMAPVRQSTLQEQLGQLQRRGRMDERYGADEREAGLGAVREQLGQLQRRGRMDERFGADEREMALMMGRLKNKGLQYELDSAPGKDLEALLGAMAQTDYVKEQTKQLGTDGGEPKYGEDPVTGERVVIRGRTMFPSGVNPDKQGKPTRLLGDDGEDTGLFVVPGRNGMRLMRAPVGGGEEKNRAATLSNLVPLLQKYDDEYYGWEARNANIAAKKEGYEKERPASAEKMAENRKQRARIARQLDALDVDDDGEVVRPGSRQDAGGPRGGGAAAGSSKMSGPEVESRRRAAEALRKAPGRRVEILKRLKDAGFSTDGL